MAQKIIADAGEQMAEEDIITISAAIAYAALTNRLQDAVTMTDTLSQLVHACARSTMVEIKEVPITIEVAADHAKAVAVASYMAKCRYEKWVAMDSKDDS